MCSRARVNIRLGLGMHQCFDLEGREDGVSDWQEAGQPSIGREAKEEVLELERDSMIKEAILLSLQWQ